jgi:hypothetical protein
MPIGILCNPNLFMDFLPTCDCTNTSDLSQRFQAIKIEDVDLTFGPRIFQFPQGMDILDLCI